MKNIQYENYIPTSSYKSKTVHRLKLVKFVFICLQNKLYVTVASRGIFLVGAEKTIQVAGALLAPNPVVPVLVVPARVAPARVSSARVASA